MLDRVDPVLRRVDQRSLSVSVELTPEKRARIEAALGLSAAGPPAE
jgi:hypothetical protein